MGNVKLTFVNFSAAILHSMCSPKLRKYCIQNGEKQVKTKYFWAKIFEPLIFPDTLEEEKSNI